MLGMLAKQSPSVMAVAPNRCARRARRGVTALRLLSRAFTVADESITTRASGGAALLLLLLLLLMIAIIASRV